MKKFIKNVLSLRWLAWIVGFMLPIKKNRIVFCTNSGGGFSDNGKYIAEELLSKNENLDIIWLTASDAAKDTLPSRIRNSRYNKFSSIIKLLTASVWVDNSRKEFLYKKKKTLYIQTWHGGGLYKRVEKSVVESLPKKYVKIAKKDSKAINIFLSDSSATTNCIYEDYWYDNYVFKTYYPRNSILIKSINDVELKNEIANKVKSFFIIPLDTKLVLYAPTFRKGESLKYYNIDFKRLINELNLKFGGCFKVLLRLHPNIANRSKELNFGESVIDASKYFDTQELLVASDVLITDYSSINYDYSFLKRPSFRYAVDIDEYMDDRGFYLNLYDYPFPLAKNNDELISIINDYDQNKYEDDLDKFNKKLGLYDIDYNQFNCSNLIVDYIKKHNIINLEKKYDLIKK